MGWNTLTELLFNMTSKKILLKSSKNTTLTSSIARNLTSIYNAKKSPNIEEVEITRFPSSSKP